MIVVADSGPIIHLSMVDLLGLVPDLFGEVLVPSAVWEEVVVDGAGLPGSDGLSGATWAKRVNPQGQAEAISALGRELDPGETAAIALALERGAHRLLVDDLQARLVADHLGIPIVGTLGILMAARKKGLVGPIEPLVGRLRAEGFWVAERVIQRVLAAVDEEVEP